MPSAAASALAHLGGTVMKATLSGFAAEMLSPVNPTGTESLLDEVVDPRIDVRPGGSLDFGLRPFEAHRDGIRCHTLHACLSVRRPPINPKEEKLNRL